MADDVASESSLRGYLGGLKDALSYIHDPSKVRAFKATDIVDYLEQKIEYHEKLINDCYPNPRPAHWAPASQYE